MIGAGRFQDSGQQEVGRLGPADQRCGGIHHDSALAGRGARHGDRLLGPRARRRRRPRSQRRRPERPRRALHRLRRLRRRRRASAAAAGHGAQPPTVTTGDASDVTDSSATVSGTVDPNGQDTTYHFDYGDERRATARAPARPAPGRGSAAVPVTASLTGLDPGTTYHYRLVAANASGTTPGGDRTFTTNGPPAEKSKARVLASDVFLNGSGSAAKVYVGCLGGNGCSGSLVIRARRDGTLLAKKGSYKLRRNRGTLIGAPLTDDGARRLRRSRSGALGVTVAVKNDSGQGKTVKGRLIGPDARLGKPHASLDADRAFATPAGKARVWLGCLGAHRCEGRLRLLEDGTRVARADYSAAADSAKLVGLNLDSQATVGPPPRRPPEGRRRGVERARRRGLAQARHPRVGLTRSARSAKLPRGWGRRFEAGRHDAGRRSSLWPSRRRPSSRPRRAPSARRAASTPATARVDSRELGAGTALNAVAAEPDGSAVAVGSAGANTLVVKFDDKGKLDKSFGKGGVANVGAGRAQRRRDPGRRQHRRRRRQLLPADVVLRAAAGCSSRGSTDKGVLDKSFGSGGVVKTVPSGRAFGVGLGPNGTVVAAGDVRGADTFRRIAVIRLDSKGKLDKSFGSGGGAVVDLGPDSSAKSVAVQQDSKIVISGAVGPAAKQVVNALRRAPDLEGRARHELRRRLDPGGRQHARRLLVLPPRERRQLLAQRRRPRPGGGHRRRRPGHAGHPAAGALRPAHLRRQAAGGLRRGWRRDAPVGEPGLDR